MTCTKRFAHLRLINLHSILIGKIFSTDYLPFQFNFLIYSRILFRTENEGEQTLGAFYFLPCRGN